MSALTDTEVYELRRMLLAFKAGLPPHELGYWYVTSQPVSSVVEDDPPPNTSRVGTNWHGDDAVEIRGHGQCVRCGKQFSIPGWGNFTTRPVRVDAVIQKAKEWVGREAREDGPCWGDVPKPERDQWMVAATLDGAA